ncbi:unnamed protein product [Amoebophrya sp. A120]|nr:unnamed protein product [Amoebophrya sp. A120]|eukprot:GSA120T00024422001.1
MNENPDKAARSRSDHTADTNKNRTCYLHELTLVTVNKNNLIGGDSPPIRLFLFSLSDINATCVVGMEPRGRGNSEKISLVEFLEFLKLNRSRSVKLKCKSCSDDSKEAQDNVLL